MFFFLNAFTNNINNHYFDETKINKKNKYKYKAYTYIKFK